jgi:hypothetical protein
MVPEVWSFALASTAFAVLYFHTLPASALTWIGAVVGAWLLPASLVEARVWGRLRPGAVVLIGTLVAAAGILVATVQGTYTAVVLSEGQPGLALGRALDQAREVLELLAGFPRDSAVLLATFALPFPLVLWLRHDSVPRIRHLVWLGLLVTAVTVAFYVPLLPEASTKVVKGSLVRVGPGEHLLGWWALVGAYVGLLTLATLVADTLVELFGGGAPDEVAAEESAPGP